MDEICKHLGLKETDKINQAVTSVVKNDVVKDNKGSKDSNKNKINQVAYSARKLKIVEKRNRLPDSLKKSFHPPKKYYHCSIKTE